MINTKLHNFIIYSFFCGLFVQNYTLFLYKQIFFLVYKVCKVCKVYKVYKVHKVRKVRKVYKVRKVRKVIGLIR